jgi:hypothetical protein
VVLGWNEGKGRYDVQQSGTGEKLALTPDSLVQCIKNVRVTNISSKPEMNGKSGDIIGYDIPSERYHVKLAVSGKAVALKCSNLIFPNRAVVRIHGLLSSPEHNGKYAQVTGYDARAGRHTVKLDAKGRTNLRLKPDHLAC